MHRAVARYKAVMDVWPCMVTVAGWMRFVEDEFRSRQARVEFQGRRDLLEVDSPTKACGPYRGTMSARCKNEYEQSMPQLNPFAALP